MSESTIPRPPVRVCILSTPIYQCKIGSGYRHIIRFAAWYVSYISRSIIVRFNLQYKKGRNEAFSYTLSILSVLILCFIFIIFHLHYISFYFMTGGSVRSYLPFIRACHHFTQIQYHTTIQRWCNFCGKGRFQL